jgi:ArsR family transcriptional regulator
MLDWLEQARFTAVGVTKFPVNMGLVVVVYEAEKK